MNELTVTGRHLTVLRNFLTKNWSTSGAVVSFVVLVGSPLTVLSSNAEQFEAPAKTILVLLSVYLVTLLLIGVVKRGLSNDGTLYRLISGVGSALMLLLVVGTYIWNLDDGQIDGREIGTLKNWSVFLEISVWLVLLLTIAIAVLRRGTYLFRGVKRFGALFVLVSSCLVVVSERGALTTFSTPASLSSGQFDFHSTQNTLVIVLDTFQSDFFNQIARDYPEEVEFLRGFSYYPDTVAAYPTTRHSISAMMAGRFYENDFPWKMEQIRQFNETSLPVDYLTSGFGVRGNFYFSPFPGESPMNGIGINPLDKRRAGVRAEHLRAIDYGLYRTVPYVLKNKVYNDGKWRLASTALSGTNVPSQNAGDVQLVEAFERDASVSSPRAGEFKLLYFWGLHTPLVFDENLRSSGTVDSSRDNFIKQGRALLKLMSRLLGTLDRLGVYDSSEIVILSDHGTRGGGDTDLYGAQRADVPENIMGSARPLLLHKPSGSPHQNLRRASTAMHLTWLPCLLGNDSATDCGDFFAAQQGEVVERRFFHYDWVDADWNRKYSPDMTIYSVRGDSRNRQSWTNTNLVLESPESIKQKNLRPDQRLGIEDLRASEAMFISGWHDFEPSYIWTAGKTSRLRLDLDHFPTGDMILKVEAVGAWQTIGVPDLVTVRAGELVIGQIDTSLGTDHEIEIPKEAWRSSSLVIDLENENPLVPCQVTGAADCRELGIAVTAIELVVK